DAAAKVKSSATITSSTPLRPSTACMASTGSQYLRQQDGTRQARSGKSARVDGVPSWGSITLKLAMPNGGASKSNSAAALTLCTAGSVSASPIPEPRTWDNRGLPARSKHPVLLAAGSSLFCAMALKLLRCARSLGPIAAGTRVCRSDRFLFVCHNIDEIRIESGRLRQVMNRLGGNHGDVHERRPLCSAKEGTQEQRLVRAR